MQVRVRGLGSLTRRATPRGGAAPPRRGAGDGDGPLADGRTPVECRAHCASSTGRQRCLARVEPVGRGGTNGGGVALRPPFTPRQVRIVGSQEPSEAQPAHQDKHHHASRSVAAPGE